MLPSRQENKQALPLVQVLVGWHVLVALFLALGILLQFGGQLYGLDISQTDGTVRVAILAATTGLMILWVVAIPGLLNYRPYGRSLSLFLNYSGFIIAIIAVLQGTSVFVGIGILAGHVQSALPAILILFGLFVVSGWLRSAVPPQIRRQFGTLLTLVLGVGALIVAVQLGLIDGLANFLRLLPNVGASFVLMLIFGAATYALMHRTTAVRFKESLITREAIVGLMFLSPNLLGFIIFFAGPLLLSLFLSFTQYQLFIAPAWRSTQNYTEILGLSVGTLKSPDGDVKQVIAPTHQELVRFTLGEQTIVVGASDVRFWRALRNTVFWVLMIIPLSIIPALLLAVLLSSNLPGMKIFRALFFLPVVAGVVGVSLIWSQLYNPQIGAFNTFISGMINTVNNMTGQQTIIDPKIQWLNHSSSAQFSVVVMAAWMNVGYNMVIFLAGLGNIPRPLYEAARVDGASAWTTFRRITLPMLSPTTFFVITTTLIGSFQVFTEPYVMASNLGAGPGDSTLTTVVYLYVKGFTSPNDMGYASAIAWILVAIIFVLTLIQFRMSERYTNVA